MSESTTKPTPESTTEPYSYHTFILPFAWQTDGEKYEKFVDYFVRNDFWTCTDMEDSNDISSANTVDTEEEKMELYKEYQYFTSYARKAIYGFDEKIVRNFSFMHAQLRNKAEYHIRKDDKEYILMLNAIRLKIFNSGIALFIMECENTDPSQFSVDDVKNINEYGRRISLPYIDRNSSLCADSLAVVIGESETFSDDFKAFIDSTDKKISMNHMADFIKQILEYGGDYKFSSHKSTEKKSFWIYPLLGDRMFVSCIVADFNYALNAKLIIERGIDSEKRYQEAKDLYEFAFIDRPGDNSCNNKAMLVDLLKKATYTRWLDWETAYFITNFSFVCLLENYEEKYLVSTFLTQYYQMFCLMLAQKASIVQFKREIASISSGFEKKKKKIKARTITDIMALEERYVAFEAQMCFDEVSPEQQGIELYDIMKTQFKIREEGETLKSQIDSLYNAANTCIGFETNNNVMIFTWIAFLMSIASLAIAILQAFYNNALEGINKSAEKVITQNAVLISVLGIAVVVIGSILVYLIIKLNNRRKL